MHCKQTITVAIIYLNITNTHHHGHYFGLAIVNFREAATFSQIIIIMVTYTAQEYPIN